MSREHIALKSCLDFYISRQLILNDQMTRTRKGEKNMKINKKKQE